MHLTDGPVQVPTSEEELVAAILYSAQREENVGVSTVENAGAAQNAIVLKSSGKYTLFRLTPAPAVGCIERTEKPVAYAGRSF